MDSLLSDGTTLPLESTSYTRMLAQACQKGSMRGATYSSLCSDADLLRVGHAMHDSLPRLLHHFEFAGFAADSLEVLEVAVFHWCDVLAAEDAYFELLALRIARRETGARALEVIQRLKYDVVGTDVLRNGCRVAIVSHKLRR
jgi:hypothetical protein